MNFLKNILILLTAGLAGATLINKLNHTEFDTVMKDYIRKDVLRNSISTCKALDGRLEQYGFSNEERQYFFCKISK